MHEEGIDFNNVDDIKVGNKIWFKANEKAEVEIGVVCEIEKIVSEYVKLWADWPDGDKAFVTVNKKYNPKMCRYGIVKELNNVESENTYNNHKFHNVIVHWASGGKIQYLDHDRKWVDYNWTFEEDTPAFHVYENWRIKPVTKKIRCRMALLKNNKIVVMYDSPTLEDAHGDDAFVKWIDPEWKEVEVEI